IALALSAGATALALLPMFAAFEAHVINVTARIENALSVTTDAIDFGTVFPQQELEKDIHVELSRSFLEEPRVDDVDYIIRQKPKCAVTINDGQTIIGETHTGHVVASSTAPNGYIIDCGPDPRPLDPLGNPLPPNSDWGPLPLLCPYLSKHKFQDPDPNQQEVQINAFHKPWAIVNGEVVWNEAKGRLAKSQEDIMDWWLIDLKVPCFGDHCGQDWGSFVHEINPNADPQQYILPQNLEHKIFGCDLWVEVTDVSMNTNQCTDTVDNDGDTLVDVADPGCLTGDTTTEADND
ncbi:MAG: hypothetical protein G01um1014106_270, partial [Parcubacteria group bacterium Gr01-1014_106]